MNLSTESNRNFVASTSKHGTIMYDIKSNLKCDTLYSCIKLIVKFSISLIAIIAIYPYIPKTGTRSKIKAIVDIRSTMLQNITPTCLSRPRSIASITLSKYISITKGDRSTKNSAISRLW